MATSLSSRVEPKLEAKDIIHRRGADDAHSDPPYPPIRRPDHPSFPVKAMRDLLDGEYGDLRDRVRTLISSDGFQQCLGMSMADHREQVLRWAKQCVELGFTNFTLPKSLGGTEDLGSAIAFYETLAYHDLSLVIKFGVQLGLFGGSVLNLGTEKHHKKYLPDCHSLKLLGAFAMTEIGHGSNVRQIETTATYDCETQQFIIHSPTFSSGKAYIGNAALDGRIATVFAQLHIGDQRFGVHAFVVPLRDSKGDPLPGIRFKDHGLKMGLNGVDNGQIWFDHVAVSRDELLDRFAQVSADGTYTSPIEKESARFFTMLGTLVGGRISVGSFGIAAKKVGLATAIRYAARRRQFGPTPSSETETLLMDYPTHQRRLIPALASTYVEHFAIQPMLNRFLSRTEADSQEVEAIAAALKAFTTWSCTEALQNCREACGGEGYMAINRFADLKADSDIFATFEGDNTVLMQLAAKDLLTAFRNQLKEMTRLGVAKFGTKQWLSGFASERFGRIRSKKNWDLPAALLEVLAERRNALTYQIAMATRSIAKKKGAYDAFLAEQTDLVALGYAFIEHFLVDNFFKEIESADQNLKPVLERLGVLFALTRIERNKGAYLESGLISRPDAARISRRIDAMTAELSRDAVDLVDAFGVPSECLGLIGR